MINQHDEFIEARKQELTAIKRAKSLQADERKFQENDLLGQMETSHKEEMSIYGRLNKILTDTEQKPDSSFHEKDKSFKKFIKSSGK